MRFLTLIIQPGKVISRTDKLRGFEDANDMSGTLHWEIGYLCVFISNVVLVLRLKL